MEFSIELPLNQTGLGNVGIGVAFEIFKRGLYPNIFVIGQPNFSYAVVPEGFEEWLKFCTSKALRKYNRNQHFIKLWHIDGSAARLTDHATLYTVHETDTLTSAEKNIVSQYDRVLVPSKYSQEVFGSFGAAASVCPNFFDASVFSKVEVKKEGLEDVTIFGVFGKMEKRKRTGETVKAWVKRFGGDSKYRLHCHVFNPFIMQSHNVPQKDWGAAHHHLLSQAIGMELPWNVTIYGFQTKEEFNLSTNAIDIDLGLSGGEGFGLPLFTSRVLGKRGVVLNAHAHKDYCDAENSVLIEPSGKEDSSDGLFFHKGHAYNQGNIFRWEEDDAIAGMEEALTRGEPDPSLGEKLKQQFSVEKTVDILLDF